MSALRRPSAEDVVQLGKRAGFEVPPAEVAEYEILIEEISSMLEHVEDSVTQPPQTLPARRDAGRTPSPEVDPLAALIRWCSVRSDDEGILSGKQVGLKDNIAVAGVPMTSASIARRYEAHHNWLPPSPRDAAVNPTRRKR